MFSKNEPVDRKTAVVRTCLQLFTKKGLVSTTSRDLSAALELQHAGIYYYFKSKDDLVIACAEEAASQLEKTLIGPLKNEIKDPDKMMADLQVRCDQMAPTMRFLTQVFAVDKYREKLHPFLTAQAARYKLYAEDFAQVLGWPPEQMEPYVYIGITAATNYMIFGENSYIKPQFDLLKKLLKEHGGEKE